ncbi:hypothetical protein R3W88_022731 [Solanum pinnatisectum]|uniref:DUF1985 domain-containing protein n=1 Tax=Solanum pinnatisectum TaxID=50273 RepID=A0AAV9LVQ1_9SOLN|nr:hypothetical protein R3W88_022731 [Solanum pinnatisectum]
MPLFFGRREFAIVSGLKSHPPSEPIPEFIVKKQSRRRKKGEKEETRQSTKEQDLVSLIGTSFKNPDLIYLLNNEDTSKKHKESLFLIWFVHNVLLAKDVNNNISLKWVNLSKDIKAFNNYPWGHDIFELTVKYLLKHLSPTTNNLFVFPWAFMAWAFEAIPHLTHQVTTKEEISSPRILRWLRAKNVKNPPDLFNTSRCNGSSVTADFSYVTTDASSVAIFDTYVTTCDPNIATDDAYVATWLVETLFDLVVDRVKMELAGATTIKRDIFDNELIVFDGLMLVVILMLVLVLMLVVILVLVLVLVLLDKTKGLPLVEDALDFCAKRRKKSFIKAIQNLKKKIFGELPMAVGEEVLEFKQVNVYKRVPIAQKNKLVELMRGKDLRAQYDMHFFSAEDFRTMTSINIW